MFETHLILTGDGCYGLGNLADLDRIPRRGPRSFPASFPTSSASAAGPRIFAFW
jgi:hypothetical protein